MTWAFLNAVALASLLCQAWAEEEEPKGHLQPLGSWTEGTKVEERDDVPDPEEFYNLYNNVDKKQGKPVVFRGAASKMATSRWGNDDEMMEKFGEAKLNRWSVEEGLKENRMSRMVRMDTLGDFLKKYNESDIYMVGKSPEPLKSDQEFLPCLRCGGFLNFLDSESLWWGRGGSKSVVHYDNQDNINCMVTGEKRFKFFHKKYREVFEAHPNTDKNKFGWIDNTIDSGDRDGGYGAYMGRIDVDKVDLIKFPGWKDIEWSYADLRGGDCIYIPWGWYHQVTAKPGRSINFHVWYWRPQEFDEDSCTEEALEAPPPKFSDCSWGFVVPEEMGHLGFIGEGAPEPTRCDLTKNEKSEL